MASRKTVGWREFLLDVLICSLGAYGGPEAHMSVFLDQMVSKKHYLNEEELIELVALCSILPGPTSTQTIVAIGHKTGGPVLAFMTMLVWALPVLVLMTLLSFIYDFLETVQISSAGLRYIGPMAVGFILVASYRIGKKVVVDHFTLFLMIAAGVITYWVRAPWVFPLLLAAGGAAAIVRSQADNLWNRVSMKPPWGYMILFAGIAAGSLLLRLVWDHHLIRLFESFYRYGYLVFGGGQVVVPVMYAELVEVNRYMTSQEFLTGYGLVQGLPGPMFSFSAYAGGMAARGAGGFYQVMGALVGGIGIFLPGLLLIFFVYPVWESIKSIRGIRVSLRGINAVAGGLIAVAALILMKRSGFSADNLMITAITAILLATRKLPAPVIVLGVLLAGFVF